MTEPQSIDLVDLQSVEAIDVEAFERELDRIMTAAHDDAFAFSLDGEDELFCTHLR